MKIKTWKDNDCNAYVSNPGNGHAVPEFELDQKKMVLVPKLDKNGNRVVHDLYADIQSFKDDNSLERILQLAPEADIEKLSFTCTSAEEAAAKSVDITDIKTFADIKDLQNRLAQEGKTLDDLRNELASRLAVLKQQTKKPISDNVDNKEVENEKNKE